jgi:hypothetical protein
MVVLELRWAPGRLVGQLVVEMAVTPPESVCLQVLAAEAPEDIQVLAALAAQRSLYFPKPSANPALGVLAQVETEIMRQQVELLNSAEMVAVPEF